MPDGPASRTVLGSRGEVLAPAAAFLAHLQALNRSPETVRTCAISLKLWWGFLGGVGCGFDKAIVDHWHGSWRGCVGKPAIALSSVSAARKPDSRPPSRSQAPVPTSPCWRSTLPESTGDLGDRQDQVSS